MRMIFLVIPQTLFCAGLAYRVCKRSRVGPTKDASRSSQAPLTGKALKQVYVRMGYTTELLSETTNKGRISQYMVKGTLINQLKKRTPLIFASVFFFQMKRKKCHNTKRLTYYIFNISYICTNIKIGIHSLCL